MAEFQAPERRNGQKAAAESTAVASPTRTPEPESRTPGRPLDSGIRTVLEAGFGHDFSQVRVHTDPAAGRSAERQGAAAFTSGADITFAPGRYQPHTSRGQHLIAHELAHVVQYHRAGTDKLYRSGPDDAAEVEAHTASAAFGWGGMQEAYSRVTTDVETTPDRRPRPLLPSLTTSPALVSLVQLTYDDGPDTAGNTRRILDALKDAGARATFYVVGKRVVQGENWRIVFDMAAAGHWLGNHAYDWNDATDEHIFLQGTTAERAEKILQTEWAIRDALIKGRSEAEQKKTWESIPASNRGYIDDVIAHGTGRFRTPGFRSHFWTSDGNRTTAALASVNQVLAATGLRTLAITEVGLLSQEGVTVDPRDYVKGRTSQQIESAVTGGVKDNSDSVLLHSRIQASADATPNILKDFKKRKLSFDPTVQGTTGQLLPQPGFAGLTTISDPPTHEQIIAARRFLQTERARIGPYLSGSVALGIFKLAQRAGPGEVSAFAAEVKATKVQTPAGLIPLANWMAVNPEWSLLLGFFENWESKKPFPRIKGITL
ncbi:DUF4157 domain-containing protein [Kitasatospora sp. NPDC050543]|uniref:eCIS core domain-containing protein n=1 Tax=Kitasatospora sp. NPDC050543 TaxID=3364054 RepID=UPI003787EF66